jgi:pyruvate ferredoxin oxidoreductase alpha subunit
MTKKTNNNHEALIGGVAAARLLKQINPEVMAVYPITPQTPIIEAYSKYKSDGEVDTEMIQVESEQSAISAVIGASAAGVRTATATSSQGLAYMHEMLYIASGAGLPILMYVSARTLSAPINIHGEHGDVMGSRDAGWIQIFSENAQEVYDNGMIGWKLAERVGLPVMVIMDGFQTSHTVDCLELAEDKKVKQFMGEYNSETALLKLDDPRTFGPVALQNSFFEFKIQQAEAFQKALAEYPKVCTEFENQFGRTYDYFESYNLDGAEMAIVIAGSTSGTAKDVVDELRAQGKKVGLLKIKLYRPFPFEAIAAALKNIPKIAVLDRAVSLGSYPPIYEDIINGLFKIQNFPPERDPDKAVIKFKIHSYIYGLGGRDTFKKDIVRVFDDLEKNNFSADSVNYLN